MIIILHGENYFIWVPRFATNNNTGDIKFVKGNSNIATDDTYLDKSEWTVPAIFTNGKSEYTGIFVDESQITDINDVINDSTLTGYRMIKEDL